MPHIEDMPPLEGFDEPSENISNLYTGKNVKKHWMLPRGKRKIENHVIFNALKNIKKDIAGKRSTLELEHRLRDHNTEELVMDPVKDNKTGKIINHRKIETNSGATRTLSAEWVAFGVLYRDEKRRIYISLAGQDILKLNPNRVKDAEEIDKIITHLLCRIQFKSQYFYSNKVRLDRKIVLKPICFLIKLLKDKRLSFYLTKEEMYIPYLKAKTLDDYEEIIKLILKFRKIKNLRDVIGSVEETIKNQSFYQVLKSRGILIKSKKGFILNNKFPHMGIIEGYIQKYTKDPEIITTEKQQGEWKTKKAVSRGCDVALLKNKLRNYAKDSATIPDLKEKIKNVPAEVKSKMEAILGNPEVVAELELVFNHELESDFLNPKKNLEAEFKLMSLSKDRLKFETFHTGKMRNRIIRGCHSDNFIVFREQGCCGIVDSKVNQEGTYKLPILDSRAMEGYIKTYYDIINQLNEKYPEIKLPKDLKLTYACFVSSGFYSNIEKNLSTLKEVSGIPVSAITISDYIRIVDIKPEITADHFLHVMSKGGLITPKDFKIII